ncbi:hypothetical protein M8C21_027330 [Ambrosia artemisiifolia]|uniref:Uncharacterized protein n=1 Tax=Ambrosia artemisiifolia TaxID=4212 RepID=A0AAD5C5U8_AMBAR|nr:hypothetical protein M8C21_027330 [Ambrosia artemisiifolia]
MSDRMNIDTTVLN